LFRGGPPFQPDGFRPRSVRRGCRGGRRGRHSNGGKPIAAAARAVARSGNRNLLSVAPSARAARRLPGARSREPDAVKSSEPGSPGEGTARTTGTHVTSGISGRAQGTASSERVRQQNERYRAI